MRTVHAEVDVMKLDVADDEGALDVLQTLGTLGVVAVRLHLESSDLNNLTLLTRGQQSVSLATLLSNFIFSTTPLPKRSPATDY